MGGLRDWRFHILAVSLIIVLYLLSNPVHLSQSASTWRISKKTRKPTSNLERAEQVKEAFRHAWDGYIKYASPDDALKPLSQSAKTTRSSWGATVVDGLSTAIMMDMPDVVTTMLEHIQGVNFTETTSPVSLFGTSIRYIGGLISAHDLLIASSQEIDEISETNERAEMLLNQAISLAEALEFAYDTDSPLPANNLRFTPEKIQKRTPITDITAAGTLALEFSHLATLSNKPFDMKPILALNHILNESTPDKTPFPGLSGRSMNIKTGHFVDAEGGWYGGAGGFHEYLLKLSILSPTKFAHCLSRWKLTADSSMTYLASHPASRPDLTFLASYNGTEILYTSDHTAHFAAANFLLGGSILKEQKYIDFGLKLVESQVEMYAGTATGLGPDKYAWIPSFCAGLRSLQDDFDPKNSRYIPGACGIPEEYYDAQSEFYEDAGFYSVDPVYTLRPEVLESLYYAYRITGDTKYQDASWEIFQRVLEHTKIESGGFAGLLDVNKVPDKLAAVDSKGELGDMDDLQYSYMLAETLLYAWLIQVAGEEGMPWHVGGLDGDGGNEWVFNTEGHPLRIR